MSRTVAQHLRTLATDGHAPKGHLAPDIAAALGWGSTETASLSPRPDLSQSDFSVTVASLSEEPALLFINCAKPPNDYSDQVGRLAYNLATDWTITSDGTEVSLLHSRWITRDSKWYQIPTVYRQELPQHAPMLSNLTPAAMLRGQMEAYCRRRAQPAKELLPVDDSLVDRLDAWRDEALRHTSTIRHLDERLQQLFAQFFVLRSVEDRQLAIGVPKLKAVRRKDGSANKAALRRLFATARLEIEGSLFSDSSFSNLPPDIIGGIIGDLYEPRGVPGRLVQYDFSLISARVLGRAYEKYLTTVISPSRILDPQLKIWNQPLREARRHSVRKARGIYYTPAPLVHYTIETALDIFYDGSDKDASSTPTIVDPACGSGSFLVAALESIARRETDKRQRPVRLRDLVDDGTIFGMDIDARAVTLAQLSLWLRLAEEDDPLPLPALASRIQHGDSLFDLDARSGTFDVVIGNPPFAPVTFVQRRHALVSRYNVARGRFDYSYLFLELALRLLRPSGVLGMICPNRLLTSHDAGTVRDLLVLAASVTTVVDFGHLRPFEGVDAYIAIVFATKRDTSSLAGPSEEWIRAIKVRDVSLAFLAHRLHAASTSEGRLESPAIRSFDRPAFTMGQPWQLLDLPSLDFMINIREQSHALEELADTFQGIKTGSNPVFIVNIIDRTGPSTAVVEDGFGSRFSIEEDILRPVAFGGEIVRYSLLQPSQAIIYPYKDSDLIAESILKEDYPLAYEHLLRHKRILEKRKSLRRTKGVWYELLWRRSENWLDLPKIVMRELATRATAALDSEGGIYLIGGIAVAPFEEEHLLPLLGFLNSSIGDWLLRSASPTFQGRYTKYEPHSVRRLPVPQAIIQRPNLERILDLVRRCIVENDVATADNLAASSDLDNLLCSVLGIDRSLVE